MIESQDKTSQTLVKRRTRAIQPEDVQFIADHVAKGLTEVHAVALLDKFSYSKWTNWKHKGKRTEKVGKLFARTNAARQNNLIENISTVADIDRAKCAGVRHDWRAAQMLAGLHDDRFRSSPQAGNVTNNQTAIVVSCGGEEQLRKMIGSWISQAPALPTGDQAKQLPAAQAGQQGGDEANK